MIKLEYSIQEQTFISKIGAANGNLTIKSSPRDYTISIVSNSRFDWLETLIAKEKHPLVIIDSTVSRNILDHLNLSQYPCYVVDATESNKEIRTVLDICQWLIDYKANRGSMLYVIGGGIVQDLGAFAGAMLKRGIPWTFVPTTLLSQADSCLGGKTAVNFNSTKNVLGLFSAPRQVFIDTEFINTLADEDLLSGLGEIFRLLVTSGAKGLQFMESYLDAFIAKDPAAVSRLVSASLSVKQSIVEFDEFELDIRRSMNYGHSIGHAVEALSNYAIPHGQAVVIGILVENRLSANRGMLSAVDEEKIARLGRRLISENSKEILTQLTPADLMPFLSNDKKAEGSNLKLATLEKLGSMRFIDLPLDKSGVNEVVAAYSQVFKQ